MAAQDLVAQTHPVDHAGREILDRDVAMAHQLAGDRDGFRARQVKLDAELVVIPLVERSGAIGSLDTAGERRQTARGAQPLRAFDANHLGAQVGQLQRAVWTGPYPTEVQNAHTA